MPKFIKLTLVSGLATYLNVDYIYEISPRINDLTGANTYVYFQEGGDFNKYAVVETTEEILAKIEGKTYVK
jgi:hypothetical protein